MVHCAVILAGGMGTRLRPIMSDRPKVMAMVAGRSFLTYLLDQLVEAGIQRTVLCTGYMADVILDELGDRYRDMELVHSVEDAPLGTGGALQNASRLLSEEMVLVLNGDSYCSCNLADFTAKKRTNGAYAGIALAHVENVARFGAVLTDEKSFVASFMEKGEQTGPGWINAGLYLLPTELMFEISPARQVSLEHDVIPALIKKGLYGYHCAGPFIDIGVPEEFQRSQLFFLEKTRGKP